MSALLFFFSSSGLFLFFVRFVILSFKMLSGIVSYGIRYSKIRNCTDKKKSIKNRGLLRRHAAAVRNSLISELFVNEATT